METPGSWKRSRLNYPDPFDTIFFDVDGILIRTTVSFRATDLAAPTYIVRRLLGLAGDQPATQPLVSLDDVSAFKLAGGFNNDWHMCYLLTALTTARLREWRDTPLAQRSSREWMELARTAKEAGHGGIEWVRSTFPESALPDYELVGQIYQEYYWGAQEYRQRFGRDARYLPDWSGYVQREEMLFPAELPAQLRAAGIRHLGMITGRAGPEVDSALERLEAHCGGRWWDVVVSDDDFTKPDPRALRLANEHVTTGGGLYIGDTADDLDLVLNYRKDQSPDEPDFLAAMVLTSEDEKALYRQRGADFIIEQTADLLRCLPDRQPV